MKQLARRLNGHLTTVLTDLVELSALHAQIGSTEGNARDHGRKGKGRPGKDPRPKKTEEREDIVSSEDMPVPEIDSRHRVLDLDELEQCLSAVTSPRDRKTK